MPQCNRRPLDDDPRGARHARRLTTAVVALLVVPGCLPPEWELAYELKTGSLRLDAPVTVVIDIESTVPRSNGHGPPAVLADLLVQCAVGAQQGTEATVQAVLAGAGVSAYSLVVGIETPQALELFVDPDYQVEEHASPKPPSDEMVSATRALTSSACEGEECTHVAALTLGVCEQEDCPAPTCPVRVDARFRIALVGTGETPPDHTTLRATSSVRDAAQR